VPNPQPFAGRNQPFTRRHDVDAGVPPLFEPINSGDFVTIADAKPRPVKLHYKLTLTTKDDRTVTSDLPLVYLSDTDALTTDAIAPSSRHTRRRPRTCAPCRWAARSRLRPTGAPG